MNSWIRVTSSTVMRKLRNYRILQPFREVLVQHLRFEVSIFILAPILAKEERMENNPAFLKFMMTEKYRFLEAEARNRRLAAEFRRARPGIWIRFRYRVGNRLIRIGSWLRQPYQGQLNSICGIEQFRASPESQCR